MAIKKISVILLLFLLTVHCSQKGEDMKQDKDMHMEDISSADKTEEEKIIEKEKYSECENLYKNYVASYEELVQKTTDKFYSEKFTEKEKEEILAGKKEISEADAEILSQNIDKSIKNSSIDEKKIDEFYEKCEGYEIR